MLDEIERTIPTFVAHQRSNDAELTAALVAAGHSREMAETLVAFVPIAVARVLLAKLNVRCSDTFKYAARIGEKAARTGRFAAEPVFVAAAQLASRGLEQGTILAVGGRSAEFKGVNQLLLNGSRPENVRLTEPVLIWAGPNRGRPGDCDQQRRKGWFGRLFGG